MRTNRKIYDMLYENKKNIVSFSFIGRLITLIFVVAISQIASADILYNDGGSYSISNYVEDNVSITGRFTEPFQSTTVDIINGGNINGNVTVGSGGIANLAGGSIQGDFISNADAGSINITSGSVLGSIEVTGVTSLHISSADVGGNVYYGMSTDYFSITDSTIGGDITTAATNLSNVSLSNSIINGVLRSAVSPKMLISECLLNSGIEASSFSIFSLFDSGIAGDVIASDFAAIYIRGDAFKVNGIDYDFGILSSFSSGNVTGLTSSGNMIDFDFNISDNAEIFLIPEPTTLMLLGLGSLLLRKRHKL